MVGRHLASLLSFSHVLEDLLFDNPISWVARKAIVSAERLLAWAAALSNH